MSRGNRGVPQKHGGTCNGTWELAYSSWSQMWQRCTNPRNAKYPRYGGRGITVCAEWREYAQFRADMGPRPSREFSIDRINNDGDYTPKNCRWATAQEQAKTRRCTWAKLTPSDVAEIRRLAGTVSQRELGQRYGVHQTTIFDAIHGKSWGAA